MNVLPVCPRLEEVDPETIRDVVQTGDLLLFCGRGLASNIVRYFTRSHWSHIGVVVRLRGIAEPLVLESTTLSASNDLFKGAPVRGIGLVPLADKIKQYDGEVALRRRQGEPLSVSRQKMVERLALTLCHRPYKNFLLCHLRAPFYRRKRKDYSAMFCSELVAEIYRRLGWLSGDICPKDFVPGHFGKNDFLIQGGTLADPLRLVSRGNRLSGAETKKKNILMPILC
tara:strand:+ start:48829 stop:49509 length:681 start_codon:yes stop_codon:yes gene_type:complete